MHLFENLSTLLEHPELTQDEKLLWIWLATDSARKISIACYYSYKQLSLVMNLSCKQVHRALFRLGLFGFLRASLPVCYGELPLPMCTEVRALTPAAPSKYFLAKLSALKANPDGYRINLSNLNTKKPIMINLLKNKDK